MDAGRWELHIRTAGVQGVCRQCKRVMPIAAKELCHTCYRKSLAKTCDGCGRIARLTGGGLCWTCYYAGDSMESARLPQLGPRVHEVIASTGGDSIAVARLGRAECAALSAVFSMWRQTGMGEGLAARAELARAGGR
jgi:hypothetical protein